MIKSIITAAKRLWGSELNTAPFSKAPLFLDVLREYIQSYIIENELADVTAEHYGNRFRNIHLFLAEIGLSDILIHEIRQSEWIFSSNIGHPFSFILGQSFSSKIGQSFSF